jgi:hypothetical protein
MDQLKLNARMKDSEREAFLMSEEIVNKLIDDIVNHIGELVGIALACFRSLTELGIACLYSISEAVSQIDATANSREADRGLQVGKLDMLLSFADISLFQKYGPSSSPRCICLS